MNVINKSVINFALLALLSVFVLSFSQVAEAKRLGSGGSFGYNKQVAPKDYAPKQTTTKPAPAQQPAAAPAKTAPAAGAAAKSGAAKWLGPLAFLAAGGLLAAMLFGDGFEGIQILDVLLIALVAFGLFMLFKRRARSAQPQQAYAGDYHREEPEQAQPQPAPVMQRQAQAFEAYNPNEGGSIIGSAVAGEAPSANAQMVEQAPEWFNAEGFIEGSKQHFVTLQQAWDAVDLEALRSYCSEALMADLERELQGVQPGENQTVVDHLEAELVSQAIEDDYFIASILFSGFIDEDGQGAHAFNEIWHIRRLKQGQGNWQLAGIQQVTP